MSFAKSKCALSWRCFCMTEQCALLWLKSICSYCCCGPRENSELCSDKINTSAHILIYIRIIIVILGISLYFLILTCQKNSSLKGERACIAFAVAAMRVRCWRKRRMIKSGWCFEFTPGCSHSFPYSKSEQWNSLGISGLTEAINPSLLSTIPLLCSPSRIYTFIPVLLSDTCECGVSSDGKLNEGEQINEQEAFSVRKYTSFLMTKAGKVMVFVPSAFM